MRGCTLGLRASARIGDLIFHGYFDFHGVPRPETAASIDTRIVRRSPRLSTKSRTRVAAYFSEAGDMVVPCAVRSPHEPLSPVRLFCCIHLRRGAWRLTASGLSRRALDPLAARFLRSHTVAWVALHACLERGLPSGGEILGGFIVLHFSGRVPLRLTDLCPTSTLALARFVDSIGLRQPPALRFH